MGAIRLLDLGLVSPVRSQTIYHALAYTMSPNDPDTIVLVSPSTPYVCIGFHQDMEEAVDLRYCKAHGLPVFRRGVGGGAVYLDRDQVFAQWVFHREHLPTAIEARFELFIRPLVETYRELGIAAYHRPVNDVQVAGRKIGGTGAARIGEAEVLVGSLMFDFNSEVMARVLRVPSEKMRDKVYRGLRDYMTTMSRELGKKPDEEAVKTVYVQKCRVLLGRDIVGGELSKQEEAVAMELDERFVKPEWLYQKSAARRSGVRIHEGVRVGEATHKALGGLIRATTRVREGCIEDLSISGDFTLLPASALAALERAMNGLRAEHDDLLGRLREVYATMGIESPGLAPEDFARAILAAAGQE